MPSGKLSVRYQLPIPDLVVLDPGPFRKDIVGPALWTATLTPSKGGLELLVEIASDDSSKALSAADAHARSIAEYITLWLCTHAISHLVIPDRLNVAFDTGIPNVVETPLVGLQMTGHAGKLRVTTNVNGFAITDLLSSFGLIQAAPAPHWAVDIEIGRQMYLAGLATESVVASFLIIYSAAAVFARFKKGKGGQIGIDELLLSEDPKIPMRPVQRNGTVSSETEFTEARNAFIHAEDRGRDPQGAAARIEDVTPRFRLLICRIMLKG